MRVLKQEMKILTAYLVLAIVLFSSGCTNISEEDVDYAKQALESGNPDLCDKIGDSMGKNLCFSTLASKNRDERICERITETQIKDGCFVSLSMIKQDPAICEKLSDPDDVQECKKSALEVNTEILSHLME